jgi:crossover junction endodeoxyribonuclease RuvC
VVGIDPGLGATGFALLEIEQSGLRLGDAGEIKSSARQPLEARLGKIYSELESLLTEKKPRLMVLEKLYSAYSFPLTAVVMGHVRGVICLAAERAGVELMELAPTEVKKALTGYGRASKEQVGSAVERLLGLGAPPKSEHVADALALAVVGALRLSSSGGSVSNK